VVVCLPVLAGDVVRLCQAAVGAGLFVPVARLVGEVESEDVLVAGLVVLLIGEQRLAEAVECLGFAAAVGDLAEECESLPMKASSLLVGADPSMLIADVRQGVCLTGPVAERRAQVEGPLVVFGSQLGSSHLSVACAEHDQRVCFA